MKRVLIVGLALLFLLGLGFELFLVLPRDAGSCLEGPNDL